MPFPATSELAERLRDIADRLDPNLNDLNDLYLYENAETIVSTIREAANNFDAMAKMRRVILEGLED